MMRNLLRIWKYFPQWTHVLAAEILRPRYRVAVSALVFDERQRILLFKHTYRKLEWGIPAGALEYGEQPVDGILREFFEETGMKIAVERLLLAESAPYLRHVSLVYLCKIVSGEFRDSDEISEIQYFDVSSLPPMLFDEKDLIRSVHKKLFGDPLELA
ncbi:MAG TPA: NUDIX domain-containing protein [Anaerolineales bacterium]|nr:NUDIX domain-containing protein [Anaerolineales bacterium]